MESVKRLIESGEAVLGIELGSTRIKAALISADGAVLASGSYDWQNTLTDGYWTYGLDEAFVGIQGAYAELARTVYSRYGAELTGLKALGVSAMMHGYLALGKDGRPLAAFRTWRNTTTAEAAERLSRALGFNIPQRWSIAHLYQAALEGEPHVKDIDYLTTLAGYVHFRLTGRRVLGVGDASGMLPIDSERCDYDKGMLDIANGLISETGVRLRLKDILPEVLAAGQSAGVLTDEGARLLDTSGRLRGGAPLCPPEGDAGTGMVATNSIGARTGNVSAGTSVFATVVLEKPLLSSYAEIDLVTTPAGRPAAMVHCNNCTSDINAWSGFLQEFAEMLGCKTERGELMERLFKSSLQGDGDCGGITVCNYFSGEPVTNIAEGRPLVLRRADAKLTVANFMKAQIYSALASLKIGLDILAREGIVIDGLCGHGGFFKTAEVGQRAMAAAAGAPVTVMENAGEGGAWGMAVLAAFTACKKDGQALEDFLAAIFKDAKTVRLLPLGQDVEDFNTFMAGYKACLAVEKEAVKSF